MTEHLAPGLSAARVLVVGADPLLGPCVDRLRAAGALVAVVTTDQLCDRDGADWEAASRVGADAVVDLGDVNVVVLLTATTRPRVRFLDQDPAEMVASVERLLVTSVALNRAALDVLGHGGRIVNVVSHTGAIGASGSVVYDACQATVASLARNMAQEVHDGGRTVVTVSVGELAGAPPDLLDRHSLGRYVEPSEVAELVSVAASTLATAFHGSVLGVTAGLE